MRKWRFVLAVLMIFTSLMPAYSRRVIFSETIPLQGHIELQEKFTLDIADNIRFTLNQDIAGTTHEIATYEFFSNSPNIAYQMRLSPGLSSNLQDGVFAFRSILTTDGPGSNIIPFRVAIANIFDDANISGGYQEIEKKIGLKEGSSSQEQGVIYVSFPTADEGFNLRDFNYGSYEASIAVEVLAD